jgi:hypothetical protein
MVVIVNLRADVVYCNIQVRTKDHEPSAKPVRFLELVTTYSVTYVTQSKYEVQLTFLNTETSFFFPTLFCCNYFFVRSTWVFVQEIKVNPLSCLIFRCVSKKIFWKSSLSSVRFHVLMVMNMKMAVFWDVLCILVDIDQHFRGAYCLHRQGDWNIYQTTWHNILKDSHLHLLVWSCLSTSNKVQTKWPVFTNIVW